MPQFLSIPRDRFFIVPDSQAVATFYQPISQIILDNRSPMAIGDVQLAMDHLRAASPGQPFPCPYGYYDEDNLDSFHITDGRHSFVAALMLGYTHLLVAYLE